METAPLLSSLCPGPDAAVALCGVDPALAALGLAAALGALVCLLALLLAAATPAGPARPDWRHDPWWDGPGRGGRGRRAP